MAITQIFMPYLAVIFLPLICLFNISGSTPTQLFTSLLALLTLNFKIVLEQPTIVTVSNSVLDAMWMGYCLIGVNLFLVLTVMRPRPADGPQPKDPLRALLDSLRWAVPLGYLCVLLGRIALALN